jgi:phosphopantothenoylcysteine decarboxylase/phosphopantothenate--cysteine ligase
MAESTIAVLEGKRLLLGVTGSIAAYKAADLASKLTQAGALVDVIMTDAARRFVSPLTFQSVTGRPVYTSMWQMDSGDSLPTHIAHIGLAEGAALLVIAPVTAHTLFRLARGAADDLLSVTALAARCPLLLAPAMDGGMYRHPATQANLALLRERGAFLIEPEEGRFASGLVGRGRLPDTSTLIGHIRHVMGRGGPLAGRQVVVTAGGTREPLDPVRYLTNRSSGKQGHALAQAALDYGADVTLITAGHDQPAPIGSRTIRINTAEEMCREVLKCVPTADVLIMSAAVADYRPAQIAEHKIKKETDSEGLRILELSRTKDILLEVNAVRQQGGQPRIVVGFAAESQDLAANAQEKLIRKGLDLIAANDITVDDAGFAADTNRITLITRNGPQEVLPFASKAWLSEMIIERISRLLMETG